MEIYDSLSDSIQKGDLNKASELTQIALNQNISPQDILDNALIKGMTMIGDKFKRNEVFVPEMLIAARAMNKALEILEPEMIKNNVENKGTIVLGTVKGDLHDIGKNLVGIMFKGAGYKVIDLGTDVSPEKFIENAEENKADLIGLSALLTTTMVNMKEVIDLIKGSDLKSKILVGGAPLTDNFAKEINADGYAPDAVSAVEIGRNLVQN